VAWLIPLAIVTVLALSAAVSGHRKGASDPGRRPSRFPLYVAAVAGLIAGVGAWKVVANVQEPVEVSTAGVTYRKQHWPWEQVAEAAAGRGSFTSNLNLTLTTHPDGRKHVLQGQRLLTPAEYAQLAADPRAFLAARYPHVRVT
jgi:hypothetical protein